MSIAEVNQKLFYRADEGDQPEEINTNTMTCQSPTVLIEGAKWLFERESILSSREKYTVVFDRVVTPEDLIVHITPEKPDLGDWACKVEFRGKLEWLTLFGVIATSCGRVVSAGGLHMYHDVRCVFRDLSTSIVQLPKPKEKSKSNYLDVSAALNYVKLLKSTLRMDPGSYQTCDQAHAMDDVIEGYVEKFSDLYPDYAASFAELGESTTRNHTSNTEAK